MKKSTLLLAAVLLMAFLFPVIQPAQIIEKHNLIFDSLSVSWDEAVPLGNGVIGALVWNNSGKLRFSLDRADLWDLRPMENIGIPEWKFRWVYQQWLNDNYSEVQNKFDAPYDNNPAPSKIPAGAIEFNLPEFGAVKKVELDISSAVCEVIWENGIVLKTFVHADKNIGWFKFENTKNEITPVLIEPAYNITGQSNENNPVTGQDLRRLGYLPGKIDQAENKIIYSQEIWGGYSYQIIVEWNKIDNGIDGCWKIEIFKPGEKYSGTEKISGSSPAADFDNDYMSHKEWWTGFWEKSGINLPDKILEKQWYLELYKFGSAARSYAPPISLQAVWTADNGRLPPWKGDFHHDLNTQMSYWHAFSSNHADLAEGFINWMWNNRETFKKYTKEYFETDGINVPGVTTLTGEPMGGWIQYAFGPTVSSWLAQKFYLYWRYTLDRNFLKEKAYPWLKDVAVYLEQVSIKGGNGIRRMPLSSSPEINDNSREAWFGNTTNYDLALIKWTYEKAAELADELGEKADAAKWRMLLSEWGNFNLDAEGGLTFVDGLSYENSHRHFSHLMAIHPLGLIDWSKSDKDKSIIKNTIKALDEHGSDYWTGYSFAWLGNLKARIFDGEGAAKALKIFAECFCLPNSFHVNGDQSGKGYSKFTYRPFTLEGNFAFAAGIQEMLIQSHTGTVRLFPAIPEEWKDVSFNNLRTEGAFLVSADLKNGKIKSIEIKSEKDGTITLEYPAGDGSEFKKLELEMSAGGKKTIDNP